jgi:hypothetical protein
VWNDASLMVGCSAWMIASPILLDPGNLEGGEAGEEGEGERNEYEQARARRVAANEVRMRALGLGGLRRLCGGMAHGAGGR